MISGIRPGEKLHEELAHASETTVPTRHPAIRAWLGRALETSDISLMIDELAAVSRSDDPAPALRVLRRYTPRLGRKPATGPALETAAA